MIASIAALLACHDEGRKRDARVYGSTSASHRGDSQCRCWRRNQGGEEAGTAYQTESGLAFGSQIGKGSAANSRTYLHSTQTKSYGNIHGCQSTNDLILVVMLALYCLIIGIAWFFQLEIRSGKSSTMFVFMPMRLGWVLRPFAFSLNPSKRKKIIAGPVLVTILRFSLQADCYTKMTIKCWIHLNLSATVHALSPRRVSHARKLS